MDYKDFDLGTVQPSGATGMDAFFKHTPEVVSPVNPNPPKVAAEPPGTKIASLSQLNGFIRVADDTLVNKSTKDLWSLRKEGEGFVIERLFQENGEPLKG